MTTPGGMAGRRLLLVDDDHIYRAALAGYLRHRGYAVTEADDGQEAVRLVRWRGCEYFDVIVMDYSMPWLTGGEAANLIRATCPDQRVLYMSGWDSFPGDLRVREAFLAKPAELEVIIDEIERVAARP